MAGIIFFIRALIVYIGDTCEKVNFGFDDFIKRLD